MLNTRSVVSPSFILCALLLLASAATAGDTKISKKELPGAVLSAFEKAYPHATIKGVGKELENGKTYFEIESVEGTASRDILYSADGKVAEIEEGIPAGNLPEAVNATVKKAYPQGTISKAERTTRGPRVEYEIHLVSRKTTYELVVAPDGKLVKNRKSREGKEKESEKD